MFLFSKTKLRDRRACLALNFNKPIAMNVLCKFYIFI